MLEVLYDPNQFFRERSEDPELLGPAIVVSVVGLLGVVRGWLILDTVGHLLDTTQSVMFAIVQAASSIADIFVAFIWWFVIAAIFFVISQFFDGAGTYKQTLTLVGWGFVPSIFSGIVTVATLYLAVQGVPSPETLAGLEQFSQHLRDQPVFLVDAVLGMVFVLWQGFIWTFAMRYSMDLELREAATTVAVPVVVLILHTGWRLL